MEDSKLLAAAEQAERATLAQPAADGGEVMDALAALIERVEVGGPTSLGFWREIFRPALGSPDTTLFLNFIAAVRDGSLDAAITFTEALLGEDVEIDLHSYRSMKSAHVCSFKSPGAVGHGNHPKVLAIAAVLAALKVYQEKEKG